MPWIDAFAPVEEAYRAQVMRDTWGHLAPEKNKNYPGRIVFSFGVYDSGDLNPTILVCDFGELDGGPWFYNAVHGFLDRFTPGKEGCIYEWAGTFKDYRFLGKKPRLIFDANRLPTVPYQGVHAHA